jgi:hypothetical protein
MPPFDETRGCLPEYFQYFLVVRVLNVFTRFHATDGIATHTVDLSEALSFAACEVSFLSGMVDFTEETKWKVARLENTCKSFQKHMPKAPAIHSGTKV